MNSLKSFNVALVINGNEINGTCTWDGSSVTLSDELKTLCYHNGEPRYARHNGRAVTTFKQVITWDVLRQVNPGDYVKCELTGFYVPSDDTVELNDGTICYEGLAYYFDEDGQYYYIGYCCEREIRTESGREYLRAPSSYWDNLNYCEDCGCYVSDDDYAGDGLCRFCKDSHIIEQYGVSHNNNLNPVFFGKYDGTFAGLGFELEVDCDSTTSHRNVDTAKNLCTDAGLEPLELRYAYDGSLSYGFEIISQPHTIKEFWNKSKQWEKMLQVLASKGYKSHDAGTCGLHVHVSRELFGRTEKEQDRAIAKVYTFFDDNWQDIVRISRRRSFTYCDKNSPRYSWESTTYKCWRKSAKGNGGHDRALNNRNENTFEYRLGRGTLNAWSFFSWVDFVLTITKNAKRITVDQVTTNDIVSWLGGIKESTARYIYKRGAFKSAIIALFPEIAWELDTTDNNN